MKRGRVGYWREGGGGGGASARREKIGFQGGRGRGGENGEGAAPNKIPRSGSVLPPNYAYYVCIHTNE